MSDAPTLIRNLGLTLIPVILSLSVHAYAHGWVATRLGDDMARQAGRLTLNPLPHIDLFGTLIIPALGAILAQGPFGLIAWPKPVPFDPAKLRLGGRVSPRLGAALVAIAGPLTNALIAVGSIALMAALVRGHRSWLLTDVEDGDAMSTYYTPLGVVLNAFWTRNVALAIFNLLPFPPLDGHHLLPPMLDRLQRAVGRYGFLFLMLALTNDRVSNAILFKPMNGVTHLMVRTFGVY